MSLTVCQHSTAIVPLIKNVQLNNIQDHMFIDDVSTHSEMLAYFSIKYSILYCRQTTVNTFFFSIFTVCLLSVIMMLDLRT